MEEQLQWLQRSQSKSVAERPHGSSKPTGTGYLGKLVDLLASLVFEPISQISLKFLTLISVFFCSNMTFRRCRDFQAFGIDNGFMIISQEGIIYAREGISKRDTPGHFG